MKSVIIAPLICMGAICANAQSTTQEIFSGTFFMDCTLNLVNDSYYLLGNIPSGTTGNFPDWANNKISQLIITEGWTVTLYDNSWSNSFQSDYRDFTIDDNCLADDGFNDKASSYRITQNATGNNVATFYKHIDYGGTTVSLPVGIYTGAQLQSLGILNDDISSLTVRPGYYVRLYQDDFNSNSVTYTKSRANLGSDNFNDLTSNIEIGPVVNGNVPEPIVAIIFPDCYPSNTDAVYLRSGQYNKAQLTAMGMADNSLSRFKIRPGFWIDLYDVSYGWLYGDDRMYSYKYTPSVNNQEVCLPSYLDNRTSSIYIIQSYNYAAATLSLNSKIQNAEINVYPNPAQDNITIDNLKGSNSIAIYNTVGQQVLSTAAEGTKVTIDISTLAKGYYQVKVTGAVDRSQSVFKIVKN